MDITSSLINVGHNPDDRTGDDPRTAGLKINAALTALAAAVGAGGSGSVTVDGTSITKATDGTLSVPTVSPGDLPDAAVTDGAYVLMAAGKVRADAMKAYILPQFATTHELTAGPGLVDSTEFDAFDIGTSSSVKYTFAQIVAAVIAKMPAGSTGTGSTGNAPTPDAGTGSGTYPALVFSSPAAYVTGTFGQALSAGKGTATLQTVANASGGSDVVMNVVLNPGTICTYPYRGVVTFSVGGQSYGITIGDSLDVIHGAGSAHTYRSFDGLPHYVQVVLTSTATAGYLKVYWDGSSIYDGAAPAPIPAGSTVTLLVDRSALADDAYIDSIEILNSATGLSLATPTTAPVRKSTTNVIYSLNGSGAGS